MTLNDNESVKLLGILPPLMRMLKSRAASYYIVALKIIYYYSRCILVWYNDVKLPFKM